MLRGREGFVVASKGCIVGCRLCKHTGRKLGAILAIGKYVAGIRRGDDDHR